MAGQGGGSTLSYLAKLAQQRAKTAMALKISPEPDDAPLTYGQPAQAAKTTGITPEEEMLAATREFLEKF